jgi:hypothetical protein
MVFKKLTSTYGLVFGVTNIPTKVSFILKTTGKSPWESMAKSFGHQFSISVKFFSGSGILLNRSGSEDPFIINDTESGSIICQDVVQLVLPVPVLKNFCGVGTIISGS